MSLTFTPITGVAYQLCYGTAPGNYNVGCSNITSPYKFIMLDQMNLWGSVKAVNGQVQSAFSNEVYVQAAAANAVYAANTKTLTIQDVQLQVANQHYQAQFQTQDGQLFTLTSSQALPAQSNIQPILYNEHTQVLTIPSILVNGNYYQVQLHNIGGYVFSLDSFQVIKMN